MLVGEREQPRAGARAGARRVGEVLAAAGADLDLGGDQLAGDRLGEQVVVLAGRVQLLEALLELERLGVESANSSSSPTVKSVEDSKTSRARSRSSALSGLMAASPGLAAHVR